MVTDLVMPAWPVFEQDEIAAAESVLRSGKVNYWTGRACTDFEKAWSAMHFGQHAISMANGSVTMEAALRMLGIKPGDEVIVSPRSYVASTMCVLTAGATPVFADVDGESGCITPDSVEAARSSRTRAVIPVHVGGWPCDMPGLVRWANGHGIAVLEDCAQAHGGSLEGRPLGTFGTISSWSFCQDKIMTTGGEGGMLCTPDAGLFRRCWSYSQHGKDYDASHGVGTGSAAGRFRWLVTGEGTNLRMTEMQAAIGLRQLEKLAQWSFARRRNSLIMQRALWGLPGLRVPRTPVGHAHYRCVVFTEGEHAARHRDAILQELLLRGIPVSQGSCPEIYLERVFASRGLTLGRMLRGDLDADGRLRTARMLGETSLTFLVHHTIDEPTMLRYAEAVRECIGSMRCA